MDLTRVKWTPYSGYYPLREEGWLMAEKPVDDLEDPEPANDPVEEPPSVPSENDND